MIPRVCWDFQDVQRVMNSHRLDLQREIRDGSQPKSRNKDWWVNYWEVNSHERPNSRMEQVPQIMKLEVEPRIIDDQLIFHTRQHVLLTAAVLDPVDILPHMSGFTIGGVVMNSMSTCPHHGRETNTIAELEAEHLNEAVGLCYRDTMKCSCCLTEFTLANYHHPGQCFEILLET
jgi:hypothetical protein